MRFCLSGHSQDVARGENADEVSHVIDDGQAGATELQHSVRRRCHRLVLHGGNRPPTHQLMDGTSQRLDVDGPLGELGDEWARCAQQIAIRDHADHLAIIIEHHSVVEPMVLEQPGHRLNRVVHANGHYAGRHQISNQHVFAPDRWKAASVPGASAQ